MKVVVIGGGIEGCGQGAALAGLLAAEPHVSRLVIADHSQWALDTSEALITVLLGNRRRERSKKRGLSMTELIIDDKDRPAS